ncbi:MAG: nitroreductase family protein [Thaumarchaeota archaeon]|nr:nitroreductase family protein [Nitrososphaerota archaeon]
MGSFFQTIKKRRSVRSFLDRPIEPSKIQKILKVAVSGPSSGGLQAFEIFQIRDKKRKEKLVRAAHNQEYVNAAVVLVFCANPKRIKAKLGRRGQKLFPIQDAAIAAAYAQLAATSVGLSSIWIGRFQEKLVQKIIRTKLRPVSILAIGYSHEKPKPKKVRKLKEIVHKV